MNLHIAYNPEVGLWCMVQGENMIGGLQHPREKPPDVFLASNLIELISAATTVSVYPDIATIDRMLAASGVTDQSITLLCKNVLEAGAVLAQPLKGVGNA